nr:putative ribonuclease H-like domain-containing protein [Tanacetum cinerariifolium]
MPPTPELSFTGLDEFVNKHVAENCKAKFSEEEPKVVRKNDDALITEECVSDNDEDDVSQSKIEKKIANPQIDLQDQRVINSGCSRHMTGNMSYIIDYEEIDGGYVTFGGNPKGGKITRKVLLRVPRKNNMYSVDLKNIVPKGGLTCLFAKATSDESKLWHRRLGHLNFKTMNKLVKRNLVRGLPSKLFKNDQTCVAYQKGKQHRASCKSKTKNSINLPLHLLHMDLFGLTFVKSLMKKMYCLVVTYDYSRFTWVSLLATKDETSGILKLFITGIENLVDHKADEVFFVRYSLNSKAFRVFNSRKKIVEENLHIRFSESIPNVVGTQSNGFAGTKASDNAGQARKETKPVKNDILLPLWTADPPFSQDPKKDVSTFDFSRDDKDDSAVADMNNMDTTIQVSPIPTTRIHNDHPLDQEEPKKVSHALKDSSWIESTQEELLQFKLQKVWTLVDLPNAKRAIGTKWVFKNKKNERGIVIRNKTRLVAQEYTQEEGIDYDEVFAPGKIKEEVYVCQPLRFKDPNFPDRVYKVEKALCRLHQALRAWYETLSTYLFDNGFQRGKIDKTLFIKKRKGDILLMSSMGELTFFLGLQVKQKKDGTFISQDKYVVKILKKFRFIEVKTANTPMETQKHLLKDEDGEKVDVHMCRSMICSLMYLTSAIPDIMFIVCACARYQVNPKVSHLHAVKKIFRYLKGRPKLGLRYLKGSPFDLVAYTDSDYARASLNRKSTTRDSGFHRGKIDKTLFIKRHIGDILLVQVYVDDNIFGSTKKELCIAFEKMMHEKFQMSSMGELTFFLGLQVRQKKDGIFISQDKYVTEIIKKHGFTEVKNASTPMETQKPLLKDEDGEEVDVHMYRSMIGSLMYLTSSRPDIMFVVSACARFQVNPKVSHLHVVKRIFRYLKGQPKFRLWYPNDSLFDLVAYTDSDYAGASLDRKSIIEVRLVILNIVEFLLLVILNTTSSGLLLRQNLSMEKHKYMPSTVASAIICLATNQKFNFSKWIFKSMGRNLDNKSGKFLMYPSLEAEQDSGNINKTQSKATPNMSSFQGTDSGCGRRGNTLQSDDDKLKLNELMELCTTLQSRVLDLEKTNTTQALEIDSLKRRVKKLEKKQRSRTHKLKRLYKVGLSTRVESSNDNEDLDVDASKQGRKIHDIDADEDITLVNDQDDEQMFDVNDLQEVEDINTAKLIIDVAHVNAAGEVNADSIARTDSAAATMTVDEVTLAQALMKIKSTKPKAKRVVLQEPSESRTTTITISLEKLQDKVTPASRYYDCWNKKLILLVEVKTVSTNPPMLNKDNYVPWSSCLLHYAKSKPNGKLLVNSIKNGPYTDDELIEKEVKKIKADDQAIQTILIGLLKDIYAAIDSCDTAQEIWLRVEQMMKVSSIGVQENKAKLFNEWERFTSTETQLVIAQKEEAGIQLQDEEFDLMTAIGDIDEIEDINANCILMVNLQQALASGTQTNKALVYDSDGIAEEDKTKEEGNVKTGTTEYDDHEMTIESEEEFGEETEDEIKEEEKDSSKHFDIFPTMKELRLEPRRKPSNPEKIYNFIRRVKGLKVFVGNFTYECNFIVLEDTTSVIDHDLGSLEVLRKFYWKILGGRFNQLSHVSSPLLSKPGEC